MFFYGFGWFWFVLFFVKNMISLVLHKVRVFNFIFFWNDESVWFAVFHLCDVYVSFWTTLSRHIICCLGEGSHQHSWRVTVRSFGLKDKLEAASAELPRGWTRRISHTTGKLYFVNAPRLHKWICIYMILYGYNGFIHESWCKVILDINDALWTCAWTPQLRLGLKPCQMSMMSRIQNHGWGLYTKDYVIFWAHLNMRTKSCRVGRGIPKSPLRCWTVRCT